MNMYEVVGYTKPQEAKAQAKPAQAKPAQSQTTAAASEATYTQAAAPVDADVAALTAMSAPESFAAPAAAQEAPGALANRTVSQQSGSQPTVTTVTPSGVIGNMTDSPFFQTYSGKYPKFNLGKRE
jgi:hypothetical protein